MEIKFAAGDVASSNRTGERRMFVILMLTIIYGAVRR